MKRKIYILFCLFIVTNINSQLLYHTAYRQVKLYIDFDSITPLYVLIGQSNAQGSGDTDSIDYDLTVPLPYIQITLDSTDFSNYWAGHNCNGRGDGFGVELWNGKYLYERSSDTIYVLKYALGGSKLALNDGTEWHPLGWPYYRNTRTYINAQLDSLRSDGKIPLIIAFIWIQGESDAAGTSDLYDNYKDAQLYFIDSLRQDLDNFYTTHNLTGAYNAFKTKYLLNETPFIDIQLSDSTIYGEEGVDSVQSAKLYISNNIDNVYLISTAGVILLDGQHYNHYSIHLIANRINNALKELYKENK